MYDYDTDYHNPPAPVIKIKVRSPDNVDKYYEEKALIDTGAFKSCIPKNIIGELVLNQTGEVDICGYNESDIETRTTYGAKVKLDNFFDDIIEVVELPENTECIVGRDILNELNIKLQGKNKKFDICIPK